MLHPEHKNTLIVLSIPVTLWILYAQGVTPRVTSREYKELPVEPAQKQTHYGVQKKGSQYVRRNIEVEIRGAVRFPGVYVLRAGSRFVDLVERAGGFTLDKDPTQRHKNYVLKDGQSYFIRLRRARPPEHPKHQSPSTYHRNPFAPRKEHAK